MTTQTTITEEEAEAMYKDDLDSLYGEVRIGHATFYPSEIIEKLDPIAYRIGLADYIDDIAENSNIITEGYTN